MNTCVRDYALPARNCVREFCFASTKSPPQNAPKITSEHLFFKNFSGGACPQTPLERSANAVGAFGALGFAHNIRTPLFQILHPPLYSNVYRAIIAEKWYGHGRSGRSGSYAPDLARVVVTVVYTNNVIDEKIQC